MEYSSLIKEALLAREKAYIPYSNFAVGAALLCKSGKVYTGCNIECVSYSPTNCGERTAIFKAVSEGEREFSAIAVVAANKDFSAPLPDFVSPCGVCRQVMAEFCSEDFKVILAKSEDEYEVYELKDLLPLSFSGKDL